MTGYSMPSQDKVFGTNGLQGDFNPHPQADQRADSMPARIGRLNQPLILTRRDGRTHFYAHDEGEPGAGSPVVGYVPAVMPTQLGDPGFCADHGLTYPYISGAMANGIGSAEIVIAMGRAGMLGFFGAAGLSPSRIETEINRIQKALDDKPFGVNLIHAPQEPLWEERVTDILIERAVHLVEASAYLALTPAVVRYRTHGIHEDALGRIITPNQIIAKVSRIEVATRFFSPPPEKIVQQLVSEGHLTEHQANLARQIPMAQDLTAEADSGGHTDNRPAITMMPTMLALRDRMMQEFGYPFPLRVGLAGGISTPASACAAFAMGAAFVLIGSVHQSCLESGSSDLVREMLANTRQADVAMAPAADMFEMGVELQVLKRGTMFPMRAAKLYELYRAYPSLEALPAADRSMLEDKIFRASLDEIWQATRSFFTERDPAQITRAERDPKHKMALVFRWYLGKSSGWANQGQAERKIDFQVWCGPAMGAFNEWARDSYLESWQRRHVVDVARNILYGAAYMTRLNMLRAQGVAISPAMEHVAIQTQDKLKEFFQ